MLSGFARSNTGLTSVGMIVVLGVLGLFLPTRELFTLSIAVAFAIVAVGTDACSGYAGLPNVGQSAFMAIGAYTTALLTKNISGIPLVAAVAAGVAASVLVAVIIGLGIAKLEHLGFALITFAFSYVVYSLLAGRTLNTFTNSSSGLYVPVRRLFGVMDLSQGATLYGVSLSVLAVCLWVSHSLIRSSTGRALMVIKESETVADVLGIRTYRTKILIFAYSAGVAAVAGGLLAEALAYVSPESFGSDVSISIFAMVAIGGLGTLSGGIIGALFFRLVPETSTALKQYSDLFFGVLFLASLMLFPGGLYDLFYRSAHSLRRLGLPRRATASSTAGVLPSMTKADPVTPQSARASLVVPDGGEAAAGYGSGLTDRESGAAAGGASVRVEGLSVSFSGVHALEDVDLHVDAGSCHALVGPNGAGKTTLLNCLSGVVAWTEGVISLDGAPMRRMDVRDLRYLGIGRSFQQPSLVRDLTVLENVMVAVNVASRHEFARNLVPRVRTSESERRLRELASQALDRAGFSASRRDIWARDLSYGELKVADVARAAAMRPKVLLLDEPTSGLAEEEIPRIAATVTALRQEVGSTVVFVSHDIRLVQELADKVTVLSSGRVLAEGTPMEIRGNDAVIDAFLGPQQEALA